MDSKWLIVAINEVLQPAWVAHNTMNGSRIPNVFGAENQGIDVAH